MCSSDQLREAAIYNRNCTVVLSAMCAVTWSGVVVLARCHTVASYGASYFSSSDSSRVVPYVAERHGERH